MRFGLWIEPEMVNPDSDLYRAHPDWVYHFANRAGSEHRNQLVLNLARPDVAEWVFSTLDGILGENHIQFVKWDMNRPFSEPGWPAEAGHNPERAWVEHVRNLYDAPIGASQYLAPDGTRIVVLAWWGPHQASARPGRLRLAGLDPDAYYLETGSGREHLGAALMQEGLALPAGAGSDFGSTLVRLSRR